MCSLLSCHVCVMSAEKLLMTLINNYDIIICRYVTSDKGIKVKWIIKLIYI